MDKPDVVVSEETGRAAIDRIMSGIVETQEQIGVPIPGGDDARRWAQSVVERQIKEHEDRVRNGLPEKPALEDVPGRINRGDVGPDTSVIERDLSDPSSPTGRRHMLGDRRPVEDLLLEGRLRLLLTFPCVLECKEPTHKHEWAEKILATEDEAVAIARRNGFADDIPRVLELRNELMLKLVEESGKPPPFGLNLGDYKQPKTRALVLLPAVNGRRALLPIEQLPKHAPDPSAIITTA